MGIIGKRTLNHVSPLGKILFLSTEARQQAVERRKRKVIIFSPGQADELNGRLEQARLASGRE